ncbi:CbrC family protein [Streptomyces lincolnensis]|uniref:CbrC family protein n=1 Tax=Streptomyces lincolnensis TaxID=1915 RepID=UPI0035ABD22B|nr:CbrC family protein [Streptomyces lincolnensis]
MGALAAPCTDPAAAPTAARPTATRPGFPAWQQSRWLTRCGDAAVSFGRVGAREFEVLHCGRPGRRSGTAPRRVAETSTRLAPLVARATEALRTPWRCSSRWKRYADFT